MKYIHFDQAGAADVLHLAEMPAPSPGPGEVLIRVEAAGVNRPDIAQRAGKYPPPPGASPILGLEVAGTIATAAPDSGWHEGDLVCALVPGGGYAEYCVAPGVQCLPIPRGLSPTEAAGIPETFFTVWANVFQIGRRGSDSAGDFQSQDGRGAGRRRILAGALREVGPVDSRGGDAYKDLAGPGRRRGHFGEVQDVGGPGLVEVDVSHEGKWTGRDACPTSISEVVASMPPPA